MKKSQSAKLAARSKSLRQSAPEVGSVKGAKRPVAAAAGVIVCDRCGAVMYDKHWHAPALVTGWKKMNATTGRCDACLRGKEFVGEVVFEGLKDAQEREEVLGLVRNIGKRAQRRDPEDRVISIETVGSRVRVTTSENQLAVSIGKQVHEARKGGELQVTWSAGDKPVRVVWRSKAK